jgi:hypothetical protein
MDHALSAKGVLFDAEASLTQTHLSITSNSQARGARSGSRQGSISSSRDRSGVGKGSSNKKGTGEGLASSKGSEMSTSKQESS